MADALIRRLVLASLAALACAAPAGAADALRDPMRPPAAAATPATEGTAPADAAAEPSDALPRLQSIRRPAAGGAPRALFGDGWVAVGGKVGEWRVRAIGTDTVTLQSTRDARETQRVSLHQLEIRRTPGSP